MDQIEMRRMAIAGFCVLSTMVVAAESLVMFFVIYQGSDWISIDSWVYYYSLGAWMIVVVPFVSAVPLVLIYLDFKYPVGS